MFREGTLLGSFVGDPFAAEKITIEFPSSKPQPEGRYVLLQSKRPFKVDIEAFGGTTAFGGTAQQIAAMLTNSLKLRFCSMFEVRTGPSSPAHNSSVPPLLVIPGKNCNNQLDFYSTVVMILLYKLFLSYLSMYVYECRRFQNR